MLQNVHFSFEDIKAHYKQLKLLNNLLHIIQKHI